ncbi:hypothetical protein [Acidithiobacillus sp.]|jgi:hypothetical protein|uniref:hypothetical protein n=1 Tax=Acidithiobacillus sp. TaxID=1872118 RepID=UPI00262838C6|nr:hypothetical protein [Acidithiobacillus sp.]
MWGLVAGTVSYPLFAWYSRRYFDEQGLERGFTRMMLVFLMATLLSSALGYGVSWVTSTPRSRSSQVQLQKAGTAVLDDELKCARNPSGAACQSSVQQAEAMERKLLSGFSGGRQN